MPLQIADIRATLAACIQLRDFRIRQLAIDDLNSSNLRLDLQHGDAGRNLHGTALTRFRRYRCKSTMLDCYRQQKAGLG